MKVPYSWLKEWVSLASAEQVAQRLTMAGLEVESLQSEDGDVILEINVTPNRGDCLSIRGIAREVAALFNISLKEPRRIQKKIFKKVPHLSIHVASPRLCPFYSLAVIEGVKVRPSPKWMVKRLRQVGIRPINALVDITNYVMIERGQPLHAFNADRIQGGKIFIRPARSQEKIRTLDNRDYPLQTHDLVIADTQGPLALAGIMGGEASGVSESTTRIFLESAFFDASTIRKTARRLGLKTESSSRFERVVDFEGVRAALEEAIALIEELCEGRVVGVLEKKAAKRPVRKISFHPSQVSKILGGAWKTKKCLQDLRKLSFATRKKGKDVWEVTVPSHRSDVGQTEDLVEEIVRLEGLHKVPASLPSFLEAPPPMTETLTTKRQVRKLLSALGFSETKHLSFLSPEELTGFGDHSLTPALAPEKLVTLANPLGQDTSLLRPSLLPSLLKLASFHHRHQMGTLRFFEWGTCFTLSKNGSPQEETQLAGLISGDSWGKHWSGGGKKDACDFFEMKGIVERIFDEVHRQPILFQEGEEVFLHPKKQTALFLKEVEGPLGSLGEVHPDLYAKWDLQGSVYVFSINIDRLLEQPAQKHHFEFYSTQPRVNRDMAFIVDKNCLAGTLKDFIEQ